MINIPKLIMGIVAVSRDCFPLELSRNRRNKVVEACLAKGIDLVKIDVIVENENDVLKALEEMKREGINSLVIYLGNFGPEGPETMLAQKFGGPTMLVAAAEESKESLFDGRGDAYCGMLNASYSAGLRNIKPYIPEYPVGLPTDIADMIIDFRAISRTLIGMKGLKIFGFGPRPHDFLACNAPIKPLFNLGVEIMENSELDLFSSYKAHAGDARIAAVIKDMEMELGDGNAYPGILPKLAQYEITLEDWIRDHKGTSTYFAFANKCWPAFQAEFGFVPCYVNSRFAGRGIPIACETDIYGALSEYMITCATEIPATLLDINNTVPEDLYKEFIEKDGQYTNKDLFMGFHCGNTASCCMKKPSMKYQLIMYRLMEPDQEPEITRGTLEGTIKDGDMTLFRLQSTADCELKAYIAEGEILDVDPNSFGTIGVFAVKEMGRFYRHVLIQKRYPHHAGIAFMHAGKVLYETLKMLGVEDISFNQPKGMLYPSENPFARTSLYE